MADAKTLKVNSTNYSIKDATARTQAGRINLTKSGNNLVFTDSSGTNHNIEVPSSATKIFAFSKIARDVGQYWDTPGAKDMINGNTANISGSSVTISGETFNISGWTVSNSNYWFIKANQNNTGAASLSILDGTCTLSSSITSIYGCFAIHK